MKKNKNQIDINKFSFAQLTSNNDGKTSGSGTMGILICTVGSLCFLLGSIDKMFFSKSSDILIQTVVFTGIGAALLGHRNYVRKNSKPAEQIDTIEVCDTCQKNPCECKPLNS